MMGEGVGVGVGEDGEEEKYTNEAPTQSTMARAISKKAGEPFLDIRG
jgi:hypothetical protein